jgi:Icc-related predicted phosphoesterase
MRITPASDLHLEFENSDLKRALDFPADTDVLVLAGDIDLGLNTARIAVSLANERPSMQVIVVIGNHECYRSNIDTVIERCRALCDPHPRVHFLENDFVDIGPLRFIGCTLWTDFSILGEQELAMSTAGRAITDFRQMIQAQGGEWFTPQHAVERFAQSRRYLEQELSRCQPETTVVVTHFPPGLTTRNPQFSIDLITAYFCANVDDIIDRYQPALWIYGHNHFSNDLQRGATRLVSNQMGYPSETGSIPVYAPGKTVFLG